MIDTLNWVIIGILAGIVTQLYETFQHVYVGKAADGTPLSIGDWPDPVHFLLITVLSGIAAVLALVVQKQAITTEPALLYGVAILLTTQAAHPLVHKLFPNVADALEARFKPPAATTSGGAAV